MKIRNESSLIEWRTILKRKVTDFSTSTILHPLLIVIAIFYFLCFLFFFSFFFFFHERIVVLISWISCSGSLIITIPIELLHASDKSCLERVCVWTVFCSLICSLHPVLRSTTDRLDCGFLYNFTYLRIHPKKWNLNSNSFHSLNIVAGIPLCRLYTVSCFVRILRILRYLRISPSKFTFV